MFAKLLENSALGPTVQDRDHYLKTGGLLTRTSIDPEIQAAAQASIDKHSKRSDTAIAAITTNAPSVRRELRHACRTTEPVTIPRHCAAGLGGLTCCH